MQYLLLCLGGDTFSTVSLYVSSVENRDSDVMCNINDILSKIFDFFDIFEQNEAPVVKAETVHFPGGFETEKRFSVCFICDRWAFPGDHSSPQFGSLFSVSLSDAVNC